jgi:His-Xaa-Ser system protein HxsD
MESSRISFLKEWASIEVIQKAAYRIAHLVSIDISEENGAYLVIATARSSEVNLEDTCAQLRQHVIDYSLREKIEARTGQYRDLVLATAYSRIIQQNSEQS